MLDLLLPILCAFGVHRRKLVDLAPHSELQQAIELCNILVSFADHANLMLPTALQLNHGADPITEVIYDDYFDNGSKNTILGWIDKNEDDE